MGKVICLGILIIYMTGGMVVSEGSIGMDMILVEAGTFQMGSAEGYSREKPVHTVTISDDYYIGRYEVTRGEWEQAMGDTPSSYNEKIIAQYHPEYNLEKEYNLFPVESVSWYDTVAFCNRLSELEGLTPCYYGEGKDISCDFSANGYRLPTEAEWEYAARGGKRARDTVYSGSNDPEEVAEYSVPSEKLESKLYQPVGSNEPNELGLHDMSGNVREWCWDWYDSEYYNESPVNDPSGPDTGRNRVLRGGSYIDASCHCRVFSRGRNYPKLAEIPYHQGFLKLDTTQGLRVVRSGSLLSE